MAGDCPASAALQLLLLACGNNPLQTKRHSGRRQELLAFPRVSPSRSECCSKSQWNSARLRGEIAVSFDRIFHRRSQYSMKRLAIRFALYDEEFSLQARDANS
jgi:hypothetical protein